MSAGSELKDPLLLGDTNSVSKKGNKVQENMTLNKQAKFSHLVHGKLDQLLLCHR